MTLRLSRGEFWLLANAVDHGLPLPILTLPEWVPGTRSMNTIYVVLNRQGHGLALPSLVETLLQVSHNGWIEFGRARSEQRIRPSADDLAGC